MSCYINPTCLHSLIILKFTDDNYMDQEKNSKIYYLHCLGLKGLIDVAKLCMFVW